MKKAAEPKTEFDEMLGILDSEDLAELASEFGLAMHTQIKMAHYSGR